MTNETQMADGGKQMADSSWQMGGTPNSQLPTPNSQLPSPISEISTPRAAVMLPPKGDALLVPITEENSGTEPPAGDPSGLFEPHETPGGGVASLVQSPKSQAQSPAALDSKMRITDATLAEFARRKHLLADWLALKADGHTR